MTDHTKRLLGRLFDAYDWYQASEISYQRFQGVVSSVHGAVEGGRELEDCLDWLSGELEEGWYMKFEGAKEEEARAGVERMFSQFRSMLAKIE